jgi:hypothetical protein
MSSDSGSESDQTELNNLCELPELQVRLLWHNGYWDGPLDGVCEYDGRRCGFSIVNSTAQQKRVFRVRELSPEALAALEKQHAHFQHYVGTHTDYDAQGKRNLGAVKSKEERNKFYKPTLADKEEWEQIYQARLAEAALAAKAVEPSRPTRPNQTIGWFSR